MVAEDHDCDYCEMNFQNRQFLSYRHVIYIKKSQIILITDLKQKIHFLAKKMILDRFSKKSSFFEGKKNFDFHFFAEKSKSHKK